MVTHMKTTVDIADDLLLRAKREAAASHTTLRSLIEAGLREVLGRKAAVQRPPIKPVTFRGKGLQPEFSGKGWDAIRDAVYGNDAGSDPRDCICCTRAPGISKNSNACAGGPEWPAEKSTMPGLRPSASIIPWPNSGLPIVISRCFRNSRRVTRFSKNEWPQRS